MSEAIIAQKGPFAADVKAGETYAWCACGRSGTQPFCDGSHQVTNITPVMIEAGKDDTLYFCGCKQTGTAPLCDGTHAKL